MNPGRGRETFYVYILRCGDNSLYTGIAKDIGLRIEQHRRGLGARYTRAKGVKELAYSEGPYTHRVALQREIQLKKLPRKAKEALISCALPASHQTPGNIPRS